MVEYFFSTKASTATASLVSTGGNMACAGWRRGAPPTTDCGERAMIKNLPKIAASPNLGENYYDYCRNYRWTRLRQVDRRAVDGAARVSPTRFGRADARPRAG